MPVTTGVVPLQLNVDLQAGDLREPSRATRESRVAKRSEAVQERRLELGAGQGEDRRPVAERQHGEHLAPGDLARLLAGGRRREAKIGAKTAGVRERRVHARVLRLASRRSTMFPISDSKSRVGARRMSFSCVPITWLRSTAVAAFAGRRSP